MLIDKFLHKATKAKKQPHWCVDHQKWETEKHDTVEPWNNQVQKAEWKAGEGPQPRGSKTSEETQAMYENVRRAQMRNRQPGDAEQERRLIAAENKLRMPADMSGAPGSPVKAPGQPGAPDPHRTWTGLPRDVVRHAGDDPEGQPPGPAAGLGQTAFRRAVEKALLKLMKAGDEETLTRWMPPGTPRDPRERPMKWTPSEEEMAHMENTERVIFPRHPKGHPQEGQWTGEHPVPKDPPLRDTLGANTPHPGSAPPPGMDKAYADFQKMWVRTSTPRPFSVTDNLLFLMKADTSTEPNIVPEDVNNMGLHKGPAEMKHVIDIPGVGRCHASNVIKGPGHYGHPEGRTMIVITLPNGERQPFYTRTGTGGHEGSSNPGEFVPIDGISTGGIVGYGWFDKHRMFDDNLPDDHEQQRYGVGDEGKLYMKVAKGLDALREAGKIATPEDLVAAGHAKLPGIEDPGEKGPWSILEVNNWLGNDAALAHNEFAHERRAGDLGSYSWEEHNRIRKERGDTGAEHWGLPGRGEDIPPDDVDAAPEMRLGRQMYERFADRRGKGEHPRDHMNAKQYEAYMKYEASLPDEEREGYDEEFGLLPESPAEEDALQLHESAQQQWKADGDHHITEHMAKSPEERNAEFNQYVKEMWNGQRHTWQEHEKHFHHAMSGFGTFQRGKTGHGRDAGNYADRAAALYDLPPSKDGLFKFSDIYGNIRERNRQSTGTSWVPSEYSKKKHGRDGTGEQDEGWLRDRNEYQFDKYPELMMGIQYKDPVYKRGQGSGMSISPLTGDVVNRDKLMEQYWTHPQGAAGRKAFGKGMWTPRPDFMHPQHGEEHEAADAQIKLNEQHHQGEAMRQMIPPESPLRGGLPPGIQNTLLKIMKGGDEEEALEDFGYNKPEAQPPFSRRAEPGTTGLSRPMPMTTGRIRGETERPEFVRGETGRMQPTRAERNRALLDVRELPFGDTKRERLLNTPGEDEFYGTGPEGYPLPPDRHVPAYYRNQDKVPTARERAESLGMDTSTPFPREMTGLGGRRGRYQMTDDDWDVLGKFDTKVEEQAAKRAAKAAKKKVSKSIENSLLKLMKADEQAGEWKLPVPRTNKKEDDLPSRMVGPEQTYHSPGEAWENIDYGHGTDMPTWPDEGAWRWGNVPDRANIHGSGVDMSDEPWPEPTGQGPENQGLGGAEGLRGLKEFRPPDVSSWRKLGPGEKPTNPRQARFGYDFEDRQLRRPNIQNSIEKSLLKLMKASVKSTPTSASPSTANVSSKPTGFPSSSQIQSGVGGTPAATAGQWKANRNHGLGASGFPVPPQDQDNVHADLVPVTLDVEKALLSLMKYGSKVKPSEVGMTRRNAMNLDKESETAEQLEARTAGQMGRSGDETGMGAEVAGMLGQFGAMVAGGKGSQLRWQYEDKEPTGGEAAAAKTGSEAAPSPQTNPQQGQGVPPPGNEVAQANPDMGPKMKFDQQNQTTNAQTPEPSGTLPIDPKTGLVTLPEGAVRTAGPIETSAYMMPRQPKTPDTGTQKKPDKPFGD